MKKLIAILLALSVVGVFLAGCSSSEDDDGGDGTTTSGDNGDDGDN